MEHIVNSRPLTQFSMDPQDVEALTPNHFLIGTSSAQIQFKNCDSVLVCLKSQGRIVQHLADSFWQRWLREYLPLILPRQKWLDDVNHFKVGDFVMITDRQAPRNFWRKGIITKLFPSTDNKIRIAEVRTASGVFTRGTHYLVKLSGNL